MSDPSLLPRPLVYDDAVSTSSIQRVLFVHSAASSLEAYANATTFTILYDSFSSLQDIWGLMRRKFSDPELINRIGFAFHYGGDSTTFCNNEAWFSDSDLDDNQTVFSSNAKFMFDLLREFKVTHVDFLACNSLQSEKWRKYFQLVEAQTADIVIVGASDDDTGNVKYGGDWVMETSMEDIREVYFTTAIENYASLLAPIYKFTDYSYPLYDALRMWMADPNLATNAFGDIRYWDVSEITRLASSGSSGFFPVQFNADISRWNVGNVNTLQNTFAFCSSFNADLSGWNVSRVSDMIQTFYNAENFNADISRWDVSGCTSMNNMFKNAKKFNQNISGWNVARVSIMTGMFNGALIFNQDLSPWNVQSIKTQPVDFKTNAQLQLGFLPSWGFWPGNKASMFSILSSNGVLSPDFSSNITSYDISNITTLPFSLTPYVIPGCGVKINGSVVTSGTAQTNSTSTCKRTIVVTARTDTTTTKTYNFRVHLSTIKRLGRLVTDLKNDGLTALELSTANYSATDLSGAYTVLELKTGGYTASQMYTAGYSSLALNPVYTATDLSGVYTLGQLKSGGYLALDMKTAYTLEQLKTGGYLALDMKTAFTLEQLKTGGYLALDMKTAYTMEELKTGGYLALDMKTAGYSALALNPVYTATDLSGVYTVAELKIGRYTALDLKTAHFSISDMKNAEYDLADLKSAYNAAELINAGFSPEQIYGVFATPSEKKAVTKAYLLSKGDFVTQQVPISTLVGYSFTPLIKSAIVVKVTNANKPIAVDRTEFAGGTVAIYAILDVVSSYMVLPTLSSSVRVMNMGNDTYRIYDSNATTILYDNLKEGDSKIHDGLTVQIGSVIATLAPPIPVQNKFFINSETNGNAFSMHRALYTKTLKTSIEKEPANKQFYGKKNRDASSVIHYRKMLHLGRTDDTSKNAEVKKNDVQQAKQRVRNSGYVVPPQKYTPS